MTWIYFFNEKQKKIHRTKKNSETFLNLEIEIFFFIIITSDASIIIWMNAKKFLRELIYLNYCTMHFLNTFAENSHFTLLSNVNQQVFPHVFLSLLSRDISRTKIFEKCEVDKSR